MMRDMFFGSLDEQAWIPVRRWRPEDDGVAREMAAVLTVTSSLTRFLERHHGMQLKVRLHDQFIDYARADESALLACDARAQVLRRRVSLTHHGAIMFDAESVLPLSDLPAELMAQLQEGQRPLGNLLLDRGLSLSRSDLSVVCLRTEDAFDGRWARRSVLRSPAGTRALVVEVFHPELWRRIESRARRYAP